MFDIVAPHDEQLLAPTDHQGLDHRQTLLIDSFGDARHAPFARGDAGAADQGEHQQQGADIAKNAIAMDQSKEWSTLITR